VAPQFPAVARVEGAEFTVDGGADEDEISGRRDRAARTGRAGLDPFRVERVERAERRAPRDVAGLRAHGDQLAPRRRLAGIHRLRVPEAAAFRRHLAPRLRGRGGLGIMSYGASPRCGLRAATPF